jgi:hypothetical protein
MSALPCTTTGLARGFTARHRARAAGEMQVDGIGLAGSRQQDRARDIEK